MTGTGCLVNWASCNSGENHGIYSRHTPAPYYTVIFTSLRTGIETGYDAMAQKKLELAAEQPGFLGVESAHKDVAITVSYWRDLESIKNWKAVADHLQAQKRGQELWYASYKIRISKVERDYGF